MKKPVYLQPTDDQPQQSICLHCSLPFTSGRQNNLSAVSRFCCYGCYLTNSITGGKGDDASATLVLVRLGVAAFLSMNIMTLNWALYGDHLTIFFPMEGSSRNAISYLLFAMSVPVYFILGIPYLKSAVQQLRTLSMGIDSLIAIGASSAFLYSTYATFTGRTQLYYDTAAMILLLVSVGRYLEATAKLKASTVMKELFQTRPVTARVVRDGRELIVEATSVRQGDIVRILPGERIPADSVIREGKTSVDESLLTGESCPCPKQKGDIVLAGSTNYDGYIIAETLRVMDEMVISQILGLMQQAQQLRSPVQLLAEKISAVFVPLVIGVAIISFSFWFNVSVTAAFLNALSVLLIACPCSLGIGATLASSIGLATCARKGLLVKTFGALETMARVEKILFDKTGTLTTGKLKLDRILIPSQSKLSEKEAVSLGASLESCSEHVVARAIQAYAREIHANLFEVIEARAIPGKGVVGKLRSPIANGSVISILKHPQEMLPIQNIVYKGITIYNTVSYLLVDDVVSAIFIFDDAVRRSAKPAISELNSIGVSATIVSGDNSGVVKSLALLLSVDEEYADMLPGEKRELILSEQGQHKVIAMVGDGVNDAPALATANVGISMASGTAFSNNCSDIILLSGDLSKIPWLVSFARQSLSIIRGNLRWAFAYNIVGIGLAAFGLLHPIFAALSMVASSGFVILNSARLGEGKMVNLAA